MEYVYSIFQENFEGKKVQKNLEANFHQKMKNVKKDPYSFIF
jgi:hypothetical protein